MADKYVTVAGAAAKDGTDWANAFGLAEWLTDSTTLSVAGDTYWIAGGTYALAASFNTSRDGSLLSLIKFIGVNSGTTNEPPVASDYATGTNRPLITSTTYQFVMDNYWAFQNLRFTFSGVTTGLVFDVNFFMNNCSSLNTHNNSGSAGLFLRAFSSSSIVLNSEFECTYGSGVLSSGPGVILHNLYCHDCVTGIKGVSSLTTTTKSILDSCTTGIDIDTGSAFVEGNTIYNCDKGIAGTTTAENIIYNNTLSDGVDGINFTSSSPQKFIDYNNYYNNSGDDVTGISKGANALAVDPQFTDASNGDFSLISASALIGAARGIQLGVG